MARKLPEQFLPQTLTGLPTGQSGIKNLLNLISAGTELFGNFPAAKNAVIDDKTNTLSTMTELMDSISTQRDFDSMNNALKNMGVDRLGNETLSLQHDLVSNAAQNRTDDFNAYKTAANGLASLFSTGDFSRDNFTAEAIMDWDPVKLNDYTTKLDAYRNDMFDVSGDGKIVSKFPRYRGAGGNASQLNQHFSDFDNIVSMGLTSLQSEGKIREGEAEFILTADKQRMSNHITEVETMAKSEINYWRDIDTRMGKAEQKLLQDKDARLGELFDDRSIFDVVSGIGGGLGTADLNELQTQLNTLASNITVGQLMVEAEDLYADLLAEVQGQKSEADTQITGNIDRWNYWSAVPYLDAEKKLNKGLFVDPNWNGTGMTKETFFNQSLAVRTQIGEENDWVEEDYMTSDEYKAALGAPSQYKIYMSPITGKNVNNMTKDEFFALTLDERTKIGDELGLDVTEYMTDPELQNHLRVGGTITPIKSSTSKGTTISTTSVPAGSTGVSTIIPAPAGSTKVVIPKPKPKTRIKPKFDKFVNSLEFKPNSTQLKRTSKLKLMNTYGRTRGLNNLLKAITAWKNDPSDTNKAALENLIK